MALETGVAPDEFEDRPEEKDAASLFDEAPTLGAVLRAVRESLGRSLVDCSVKTRVHTRLLRALEEGDFSALPSRVFSIGYVRAYANALGLDEQTAIERFKRESPDSSVPLQAPIGIAFQDVRRYSPRLVGAVAALALAVVAWNVFQHLNLKHASAPSDIAEVPKTWAQARLPGENLISVGAPLPAPADQTTPALYITPGLEAQLTGMDPADPAAVAAAAAASAGPVQAAFNPRGTVYGAPATASQVVIQAKEAGLLVVTQGEGQALFARQLVAGEAWRAPLGLSATIDVSEPAAFNVYLNGEYAGPLPAKVSPLGQLNARAAAMARQTAAQAEAAQAAAARAAAARASAAQSSASSPSPAATQPPVPAASASAPAVAAQ
jgi:hypothetical protein